MGTELEGTTNRQPRRGKRIKVGGARRDRTDDLLHAMQALSQLSYGPANCELHNLRDYREFVNPVVAKQLRPLALGLAPAPDPQRQAPARFALKIGNVRGVLG